MATETTKIAVKCNMNMDTRVIKIADFKLPLPQRSRNWHSLALSLASLMGHCHLVGMGIAIQLGIGDKIPVIFPTW